VSGVEVDRLNVRMASPASNPLEMEAEELVVPGTDGVFTLLPGHTPLLSTLATGVLIVLGTDGSQRFFAVNGGFAEIVHNNVLILAHTIESADQIDVARAEEARERAERRLNQRLEEVDMFRAEAALFRSLARLKASRKEGL
jgi:F-type H+-transporting ATPase subunit epsilon